MKIAARVFNRLTEVEKTGLRGSTQGMVEHLSDTSYMVDLRSFPQPERSFILTEVQALCNLEYATKSEHPGFGQTWLF